MLDLKNFDAKRATLEELVTASADARMYLGEFLELGVDAPEWLEILSKSIRREVRAKNADRIANKIRDAEARLEALKTPSEKRTALEAELKNLKRKAIDAE